MLDDPQVEVAFGEARELGQQVVLADGVDDRQVDLVVPMRHGLVPGTFVAALFFDKVLVNADVLQQLGVIARLGEHDIVIWTQRIQMRLGNEILKSRHHVEVLPFHHGICHAARPLCRSEAVLFTTRATGAPVIPPAGISARRGGSDYTAPHLSITALAHNTNILGRQYARAPLVGPAAPASGWRRRYRDRRPAPRAPPPRSSSASMPVSWM